MPILLVYLPNTVSVFTPSASQLRELARELSSYRVVSVESEAEFLARLPEAEVAVVWQFSAHWYARATRLRHVCTPAAGRELVALDTSARVRVHFGTFHGAIMAESLLGMMLFMKRRFGTALEAQRARRWDRTSYVDSRPLAGEVALIVGFGRIGKLCARLLRGLGVTVHGLRRSPQPDPDAERVFGADRLLEALPLADHVVCILPSDTGTDDLLGGMAFERMKPSAFVYNLGRGNAIDAGALSDALRAGKIAGAFLDVLPEEPLPAESPLWDVPNLYFTPHVSAVRSDYLDCYFRELAGLLAIGSGAPAPL